MHGLHRIKFFHSIFPLFSLNTDFGYKYRHDFCLESMINLIYPTQVVYLLTKNKSLSSFSFSALRVTVKKC